MASLSLYDLVVPTLTRGLKTLDHVLAKAEAFAKEQGLDADAVFPQARLVADQNPLVFQVQNATKAVKVIVNRITGGDSPLFPDKEVTIADLHARVQLARDFLKTVDPKVVNAHADAPVDVPLFGKTYKLTATTSALQQGIPNFLFHVVTAYSIVRAKGVPVGKADYITSFLEG